jgi:hypothetical protein
MNKTAREQFVGHGPALQGTASGWQSAKEQGAATRRLRKTHGAVAGLEASRLHISRDLVQLLCTFAAPWVWCVDDSRQMVWQ